MSLIPIFSPYRKPIEFSETDTSSFTSVAPGGTTVTFSNQAIGAADANRRVYVGAGGLILAGRTLVSATIGGISASLHVSNSNDSEGNEYFAAIFSAAVPTGTTANVVLTFSGTLNDQTDVSIAVYRALYVENTTAYDTDAVDDDDSISLTLDTPSGGFVIACCGVAPDNVSGVTVSVATEEGAVGYSSSLAGEVGKIIIFDFTDTENYTLPGAAASFR